MKEDQKIKKEMLKKVMENSQKKYGKKIVVEGGYYTIEFIPTGCYSLDQVLGGGIPRGRIIEIFGLESSGKSALAAFLVAQFQKQGKTAMWFDLEHVWDDKYAKKIGVDTDLLIKGFSPSAELTLTIMEEYIRSCAIDVMVIDSVDGMLPDEMAGKDVGDKLMAPLARLMGQGLRKMIGAIADSKTSVIFVNQLREKMNTFAFGNKYSTSGGLALRFYSSVRLEVTKIKKLLNKDGVNIGNRLRIKVVKSKVGDPSQIAELDLYFASGIDVIADIFDQSSEKQIIKKSGNTYEYGDTKLGVGRDTAIDFLKKETKIFEKIKKELENK